MVSEQIGNLDWNRETSLTPHLDDFTAKDILDELLEASCEVPLQDVNDMAIDAGFNTSDVLQLAEKSETCHVDYLTGHIRCNDITENPPSIEEEDG